MKTRLLHVILVAMISALLGYYIGVSKIAFDWKNFQPTINVISKEPPVSLPTTVDFSLFWNIWERVEKSYYNKSAIDGQKMLMGAIAGMLQSLDDDYTIFLPPVQNEDFKQGMSGEFEGIGAELGMRGNRIVVVEPIGGMPAVRAGVRTADAILQVNKESTKGWTVQQAVEKIRGPKGTKVTLTVLHKDETKPVDITIVRDTINVKSVIGWVKQVKDIKGINVENHKDDRIAYIRLYQFGDKTNDEWIPIVNDIALKVKSEKDVKGVILDLRNNPGGYLSDAVFIASEFLRNGVVVIQDKGNGNQSTLSVSRKGLLTDVPLIVLINKGSASASEIVAGALRDHKRALLVGETSFGKGTIQQAEDLGNGAGLHITIAKWLTPDGGWINSKGLKPDIEAKLDPKNEEKDKQLEKAVEELVK